MGLKGEIATSKIIAIVLVVLTIGVIIFAVYRDNILEAFSQHIPNYKVEDEEEDLRMYTDEQLKERGCYIRVGSLESRDPGALRASKSYINIYRDAVPGSLGRAFKTNLYLDDSEGGIGLFLDTIGVIDWGNYLKIGVKSGDRIIIDEKFIANYNELIEKPFKDELKDKLPSIFDLAKLDGAFYDGGVFCRKEEEGQLVYDLKTAISFMDNVGDIPIKSIDGKVVSGFSFSGYGGRVGSGSHFIRIQMPGSPTLGAGAYYPTLEEVEFHEEGVNELKKYGFDLEIGKYKAIIGFKDNKVLLNMGEKISLPEILKRQMQSEGYLDRNAHNVANKIEDYYLRLNNNIFFKYENEKWYVGIGIGSSLPSSWNVDKREEWGEEVVPVAIMINYYFQYGNYYSDYERHYSPELERPVLKALRKDNLDEEIDLSLKDERPEDMR